MVKNNTKNISEKINNKREKSKMKPKLNPFEIHINKEKMLVLGQKGKNDRGQPGISKSKAIKKRKDTLLQEYKLFNKTNQFMDRRIDAKNQYLNPDDLATIRFNVVKKRAHKKSVFNLDEDDDEAMLTHKGQILQHIEKYDDPRSDDDDDDDDGGDYLNKFSNKGNLNSDFVENVHFNSLFTKKDSYASHKEIINQLIADSKQRKAEKQKLKETTLELTEKLDSEWKTLLPLVTENKEILENKDINKIDEYDKIMRKLKFEARGTVSDPLKTNLELIKEEKEKLEKFEQERINRMHGVSMNITSIKNTHKSADDLDDNFIYDLNHSDLQLTYNEKGESNIEIDAYLNGKLVNKINENINLENQEMRKENNSIYSNSGSEEETNTEDDLSDLKAETSETESEDEKPNKKINEFKIHLKHENDKQIKMDLKKKQEIMEKARDELPYTFNLPKSFKELMDTFENRLPNHHGIIIERMIKCNHPSLSDENKIKLGLLFDYILQYLNNLGVKKPFTKESINYMFETFSILIPQIFTLAHLNPENCHNSIKKIIEKKYNNYSSNKKTIPGFEVLLFFKLINLLFTTSDFRHDIVTPCLIFMEQILNKCRIINKSDITYGLFIVTLVLEYTNLSKRFLPTAINFLGGLIHMAIPKNSIKILKISSPFKSLNNQLVLYENCNDFNGTLSMTMYDLIDSEITNEFKIRVFFTTIKLLEEFNKNFKDLSSNVEIFKPIVKYLEQIPIENYPNLINKTYELVLEQLKNKDRKLNNLIMETNKPKALRLYDPKIEEIYDGKKFKIQSHDKIERNKMIYKLKKETKGALKEIRRDKSFLGRIKLQQRIKSDIKRKEKVKQIYHEASLQQSEFNKLQRKKKKKI